MQRRILHIDMDAFFAAVEQVLNPALRGKPLIVGGNKEDIRGVVSTASYEARAFGVHSAMPLSHAKRLCPDGIFMRGNHAKYREESKKIRKILEEVSPLVQMASIDEAYVDISASLELFGGDEAVARHIKQRIHKETQLPCTIATSSNKLVSKIASEFGKPNGYVAIASGEESKFLSPLPVSKMPGVGPRCRDSLYTIGINTLGELAQAPMSLLERRFGLANAVQLQRRARGESNSPVVPHEESKSISRETTFAEDRDDWDGLERVLAQLLERCLHSLRKEELEAKCLTLKVRYADFETKTFAQSLPDFCAIDRHFMEIMSMLLPKARVRRDKIRLVGIGLSQLRKGHRQLLLFNGEFDEKWKRALQSVDALREKLGDSSVQFGKSMEKD